MKRIAILGSTGSIGRSTLSVAESYPERFQIVTLAAGSNVDAAFEQACQWTPRVISMASEPDADALRARLKNAGHGDVEVVYGAAGTVRVATHPEVDFVVSAIVGVAGLEATYEAVRAGKTLGLANKECLVAAGELITAEARQRNVALLPIDSEHNAIFQCLGDNNSENVSRLVLTASGGPFRTASIEAIRNATPEQAVAHPNWTMGAKISVDSATLMNKGLELIEASYLFGLPSGRIEVVVHPQSVIHSMVEFIDGSVLAQLGSPDMRIPIAYALAWPERMETPAQRLDLAAIGKLEFEAPDLERFPALGLAREALESGGAAPAVLNAANEVAVAAFLGGKLGFAAIAGTVEDALARADFSSPGSIGDVLEIDQATRADVTAALQASTV
jgi:1-deoxy-D-xylulose-5-phosphate reductoisomerase